MVKEADLTRFGVAVIESLDPDESPTGFKLYNEVMLSRQNTEKDLFYDYYKVAGIEEVEQTIQKIINNRKDNELIALHVEAHGIEKGVKMSSGEVMPWKRFLGCCRALNEAMGGLLIVTTAICYSISLMAAIDPSLRAPFKAVIITRREVYPDEILNGYSVYFSIYRHCLDVWAAKEAMRREVNDGSIETSPFEMITSEWIFDEITNPDRDPAAFKQIVNTHFCELKAKDPSYTRERVEREIRQLFSDLVKNGKDYYNFKDFWKR